MRIAIIEDNETLANAITYRLRCRGHSVDILTDGSIADTFLAQEGADMVVLDINLPRKNGLSILKSLRDRGDSVPVILLTARKETSDRVTGLDLGADDYLVKPFEMDELEARIRALSRRRNLDYGVSETIGQLEFNRNTRVVTIQGKNIDLPRKEISVLECLLDRRNRIVPKNALIDHVYGIGADIDSSAVEPHISRLRKRLKYIDIEIKVARGLGYMIQHNHT